MWVVAPVLQVGVDFTRIQEAVDVAADGDTVLVRDGSYDSCTVAAKALTLVADGAAVYNAWLSIERTASSQPVVVRGLGGAGVRIVDCRGSVVVEDCRFGGSTHFVGPWPYPALVSQSDRVRLGRCVLGPPPAGSHVVGLSADTSGLAIYDCVLAGAHGGIGYAGFPEDGASGAALVASTTYASGCAFRGGTGLQGSAALGMCFFSPTSGGDGVQVSGGALSTFDCRLEPGARGADAPPCPPAGDGRRWFGSGSVVEVAGIALGVASSAPTRMGAALQLDVVGEPGALAVLLFAPADGPAFVPLCGGVVLSAPAQTAFVPVGVLPITGGLALTLPVPDLGLAAVTLQAQVAAATSHGCQLGAATTMPLLAPGF